MQKTGEKRTIRLNSKATAKQTSITILKMLFYKKNNTMNKR